MTGPSSPGSGTPANPPSPSVAGAAIQISCVVALVIYAAIGAMRGVALDRWVIGGIVAFGLGAKPETVLNLFRRSA